MWLSAWEWIALKASTTRYVVHTNGCSVIYFLFSCVLGLAYLQGLNLERVVMCQLNPLNVCLPAVINLFAAFTR